MATVPVVAPHLTFLQKLGHDLAMIFKIGTAVAVAAEPIINVAFPGWAALYDTTVQMVQQAEAAAVNAGAQNGTGAQKLAMVGRLLWSQSP